MSTSRRQFLAALGSTAVVSLGGIAPRFLREAAAQQPRSARNTILVVVQLTGGNDGLNTVVPFADDAYQRSRPTLRITAENVLKINDQVGFHPSLRGLADLLESSRLSIVQGAGYPDPNRSHFESMDIWHTCFRKTKQRTDGWLGRYLDAAHTGAGGDVPALHLGNEKQPFALAAQHVRVPSLSSLEGFRLQGDRKDLVQAIQQLAGAQRPGGPNELLGFIQTSTTSALVASEKVEAATRQYKSEVSYPETPLAQRLKTVAQLINAGLDTRVYYTSLDGFDTHSQQAAAHAGLLNQLGTAVAAFVDDIDRHGHGDRVMLMSFSEFGRRVAENASEGTDHGAAAPMFLAGKRVRPGLIGQHPSLTDLEDGDLKFHTDFRQVYAAILENWLGWPSADILGGEYQPVSILAG